MAPFVQNPTLHRPIVAIGVIILRPGRCEAVDVLLIRRRQPPRQGEWSIPGGKQETGETVRETAHREVFEETGLHITIAGLVDVVDLIDETASLHYTLIDFAACPAGGTLKAGSDATEARWVPLSKAIHHVSWGETKRILQDAATRFPPGQ